MIFCSADHSWGDLALSLTNFSNRFSTCVDCGEMCGVMCEVQILIDCIEYIRVYYERIKEDECKLQDLLFITSFK